MSAARLLVASNVPAIRSTPLPALTARSSCTPQHLRQVLVPAAGQADQIQLTVLLRKHPGQRVGGLERGDYALLAGEIGERAQCLAVGHRHVARTAAVAQERVLGTDAGIVEA